MRKKIGALLALFWVVCIGTAWGDETKIVDLSATTSTSGALYTIATNDNWGTASSKITATLSGTKGTKSHKDYTCFDSSNTTFYYPSTGSSFTLAFALPSSGNYYISKVVINLINNSTSSASNAVGYLFRDGEGTTLSGSNDKGSINAGSKTSCDEQTLTPTAHSAKSFIFGRGINSVTGTEVRIAHIEVWVEEYTPCYPVSEPTDLTCSVKSSNSLTYTWTAASNASSYTATLYSDSECETEVKSSSITGTSVDFSNLEPSTTYYCKVQSIGNGTTYCAEGGVTDAARGTTSSGCGFTIYYDKGTGNGGTMANETCITSGGNQALKANSFTKTGYSFTLWTADVDVTINDATVSVGNVIADEATLQNITEDITLTAQWSVNSYTLEWDKNAEDADALSGEYTYGPTEYGATITKPNTPTRDGYSFVGWATSASGDVVTISTMPAANTTYYAQWEENVCPNFGIIFSLTMKGEKTASVNRNSSLELTSDYATISGGTVTLYNSNGSSDGKAQVSTDGGGTIRLSSAEGYVKIDLDCEITTGTVLTITNGSGDQQPYITSNGARATTYQTSVNSFTFPAAFNNKSTIYLWRTGSNTYIHSITITRPHPVKLSADTWASFCPSFDVTIPSGVTAYKVAFTNANTEATATALDADTKIKAGEGVLLKAAEGGTYQFPATSGATELEGNDLHGTITAKSTFSGDSAYYVLANIGEGVKFYKLSNTSTIPANKAYLRLNIANGTPAPSIRFIEQIEETTTSVEAIKEDEKAVKFFENGVMYIRRDGIIYDAMGRIVK